MHDLLQSVDEKQLVSAFIENDQQAFSELAEKLLSSAEDLSRLCSVWKDQKAEWMLEIRSRPSNLRIKLLNSAMVQNSRAANYWLEEILERVPDLQEHPVYFVSSNLHSAANLVSGYALHKEAELHRFLENKETAMLREEWENINKKKLSSSRENLLYYVLKKYQQSEFG